jgi:hypothetical protein
MNVGLAKPMPGYLVYSKADLISAQTLAAMRAWPAAAMDFASTRRSTAPPSDAPDLLRRSIANCRPHNKVGG